MRQHADISKIQKQHCPVSPGFSMTSTLFTPCRPAELKKKFCTGLKIFQLLQQLRMGVCSASCVVKPPNSGGRVQRKSAWWLFSDVLPITFCPPFAGKINKISCCILEKKSWGIWVPGLMAYAHVTQKQMWNLCRCSRSCKAWVQYLAVSQSYLYTTVFPFLTGRNDEWHAVWCCFSLQAFLKLVVLCLKYYIMINRSLFIVIACSFVKKPRWLHEWCNQ